MTSATRIRRPFAVLLPLLAACTGGGGESADAPMVETVQGECGDVFGGHVCTWGETTGGEVTAFGATVPMVSVANAPPDAPMEWPPVRAATLALPEAVRAATGLQVLTVYWEAHGHPPGAYLTPHWDFHFYGITQEEIAAIDCQDVTKPAELPAGYALPDIDIPGIGMLTGICVPQMGMHSLLASEAESTDLFRGTMVVGWNRGSPIFIEPMIASATLNARADFSLEVPAIPGTPAGWHLPSGFQAKYDAENDSYRFEFPMPGAGSH